MAARLWRVAACVAALTSALGSARMAPVAFFIGVPAKATPGEDWV
jgi:hypothetical protein